MLPNECKLLVVGAGGIGCELLKNLVVAGFTNMVVVDLDTIDLSNLNRQFLFRTRHIKQSKAVVACKAIEDFCSDSSQLNIVAHHANVITDPLFHAHYFAQFDIVINALDNADARKHVNRMCVINNKPLIESGTAGLLGQATLHIPRVAECFECVPKSDGKQKTYAICTIRSTPSLPIHCIVWAKSFLFSVLFGDGDEENGQGAAAETEDQENRLEIATLNAESKELETLKTMIEVGGSNMTYAQRVFEKIFERDVRRVASVDEMWSKPGRIRPVPMNSSELAKNLDNYNGNNVLKAGDDHKIWSMTENYYNFIDACCQLATRYARDDFTTLDFDKDDDEAMKFVTAAANLRSLIYSIKPLLSYFDAKQMAGSIIPAIASTNAIIAGAQTEIAKKVCDLLPVTRDAKGTHTALVSARKEVRASYLSYGQKYWIQTNELMEPAADCKVCSSTQSTYKMVQCETALMKLEHLVQAFQQAMGGEIVVTRGDGALLYDMDFDDNLQRPLAELMNGSPQLILTIIDEEAVYVPFHVYILQSTDQIEGDDWMKALQRAVVKKPHVKKDKRKLEESDSHENNGKKSKLAGNMVTIDDDNEMLIVE